jgi:tetratricopeptide (TPR) repeat protein
VMKMICSMMLMLALCLMARASEVFDQANRSYESGEFLQAVEAYEGLLKEEGPRVSVLNNLGSAYFRLGEYGRAILAFERALVLEPGDSGLRANLKLAQDQAAVFPEGELKGWRGWMAKVSPDGQAVIVMLAALLLPVGAFLMIRYRGKVAWAAVMFVLSGMAIKMVLSPLRYKDDAGPRGVILVDTATVRLSPFEKADSRGTLSGGREVTLGKVENHYYWIEANNGSTQGWVHKGEVAPVIP